MTQQTNNLPAKRQSSAVRGQGDLLTEEHRKILKGGVCKELNDVEFETYLVRCKLRGADPFSGLLLPVVYHKNDPNKRQMILQAGIDFKRARANSSGEFEGVAYRKLLVVTKGGEKVTIDHREYDPSEHVKIISATVGVWRRGFRQPEERTALFDRFNKKENLWNTIPDHMILKVAESHALTAAFPDQLQGIYVPEEMDWANPPVDVQFAPVAQPALTPTAGRQKWTPPPQAETQGQEEQDGTGDSQDESTGQEPPETTEPDDIEQRQILRGEWVEGTIIPLLIKQFPEFEQKKAIGKVWMFLKKHYSVETLKDLNDDQAENLEALIRTPEFETMLVQAKVLSA